MRRLTIVWQQVRASLEDHVNNFGNWNSSYCQRPPCAKKLHVYYIDTVRDVLKMSESFPNEDDLSGAVFSLAQLQGAYRLNVSQLARGLVQMSDQISFTSLRGLNGIFKGPFFLFENSFSRKSTTVILSVHFNTGEQLAIVFL